MEDEALLIKMYYYRFEDDYPKKDIIHIVYCQIDKLTYCTVLNNGITRISLDPQLPHNIKEIPFEDYQRLLLTYNCLT